MKADDILQRLEDDLKPLVGKTKKREDYWEIFRAIKTTKDAIRLEPGVPDFTVTPEFRDGKFAGVSVSLKLVW